MSLKLSKNRKKRIIQTLIWSMIKRAETWTMRTAEIRRFIMWTRRRIEKIS